MCENCGPKVTIEVPDIITLPGYESDSPEQEAFDRRMRDKIDKSGRYGITPVPIDEGSRG